MNYSTNPQFRVESVGVADGGVYTCFYRLNLPEGVQNSALSAPVSVNVEGRSLLLPSFLSVYDHHLSDSFQQCSSVNVIKSRSLSDLSLPHVSL